MKTLICLLGMLFCLTLYGVAQPPTKVVENVTDSTGMKQGKWVEYFSNGKVKSISYYKNNKLDSIYLSYYETGELEFKISFANGLKDGRYTRYFKNGTINYLNIYNADKPVWTAVYDEEGYIVMEEIFQNGKSCAINHYEKGKYITTGTPR